MREGGKSLGELSEAFGISKSTASLWSKEITLSKQGAQRLKKRISRFNSKNGIEVGRKRRSIRDERLNSGYLAGKSSNPTSRDAMCVGLYWGDGGKSDEKWKFSNIDRDSVIELIEWAIRAGHDGEFAATVNAYDDSCYTDKEIEDFWKEAGISWATIIRLESKCDPKKRGRHPFGTCHVRSSGSSTYLFGYYKGQKDASCEKFANTI